MAIFEALCLLPQSSVLHTLLFKVTMMVMVSQIISIMMMMATVFLIIWIQMMMEMVSQMIKKVSVEFVHLPLPL